MREIFFITNIVVFIILFGGYCALIFNYQRWFFKLKQFIPSAQMHTGTGFSIIIPARNEEKNIANCVNSILQNNYPEDLFEIIVVDDFSEDRTAEIVQKLQSKYFNIKLIQLKNIVDGEINSYKKKAIETAIDSASNEWIITTDADCEVKSEWLNLFDKYIQQTNSVFIAAPVMFKNDDSFLSVFQCLDFISLQGITAASVSAGFLSMCNGANLAYKKSAFYEVNGFKGVDNIASGDDMLLMHKIKLKFPKQIGYLFHSNAIVSTLPADSWKNFFNQRIRWASKATNYDDKRIFLVLLLVYFFNLYLLVLPFLAFYDVFFLKFWLILLAAKTICELGFMFPVAKFFSLKTNLQWFPLMQPFHIFYTVVSGFLGKFGKYEWKGRSVK
jgi:cellulose synthase/poly-beta-1,6-N-acetylglucosamine synthase-like glycosyltransferase